MYMAERKNARASAPTSADASGRQKAIGDGLRRMFDDVLNEPVPDDFLSLLQQADDRKNAEDANDGDGGDDGDGDGDAGPNAPTTGGDTS